MVIPNYWNGLTIGTNLDEYMEDKNRRLLARKNTLVKLHQNVQKEYEQEMRIIKRIERALIDRRVCAGEADLLKQELTTRCITTQILNARLSAIEKEYNEITEEYNKTINGGN